MNIFRNRNSRGFTLIELMIVMALMAILTTALLASFRSSQQRSKDSKRKNDLRQIAVALEAYYNDHNSYPADDSSGTIFGCGTDGTEACVWGDPFQDDTTGVVYMPSLPEDPTAGQRYFYNQVNSSTYMIFALLENTQDSEIVLYDSTNCVKTGVTTCNYGISSTNTTPQ